MARILLIALFVSWSTLLVHAFHLEPYRARTATRASNGYRRVPNIATAYDKHVDNTIGGFQSSRLFAVSSDHSLKKQGRICCLSRRISSFLRLSKIMPCRFRTLVASFALFLLINLTVLPVWAANSNGRMGGSFKMSDRSRSPSISRTIRPSQAPTRAIYRAPTRTIYRAPTRTIYPPRSFHRNRSYNNFHQANGEQVAGDGVVTMTNTDGTTNYVRKVNTHPFANSRFSASDIVLVSGVTAVVTNGVLKRKSDREKYDDDNPSLYPLGPGISVWRMTACLNVPNLNDPTSIVRRLQRLAEMTSTQTRDGLQTILSETSLELLRQLGKGSIASVESRYDHYRLSDQAVVRAERQYNFFSVQERGKFDRESFSNSNGIIVRDVSEEQEELSPGLTTEATASVALVQIHVVIEGNAMKDFGQRQMETRRSFQEALVQLSGDLAAVEDCVLSGEVLWSPQQVQEVMTEEDVYAINPTLWPVDYSGTI